MSTEKTAARWYVVADKRDDAACLVEASNRAQAYRRAGEYYCTARPASVDEALRMARDGRDVIYAPNESEQLDLEDSVVTGTSVAAPVKEGATPEAPTDPGAFGPLSNMPPDHPYRAMTDSEPEPELPKVTDIVPEARPSSRPKQRKASEVFGAGFGPKDEPDVG